jgi:DNA-binding NarL/FixJ family response regulator
VTRVAIVAASPFERAGLEAIVASEGLGAAGSFAEPGELLAQLAEIEPDAVLVALDPHDEEPPAEVFALAGAAGGPPIAVLAADASAPWAGDALRAGLRAVLPRDASAREIAGALQAVAAGLVAVHADAVEALVHELPASARGGAAAHPALTPRELEVLRMLAEGLGNKIISARLGISEHTVKFHIASIFAKLNAGSRTEAVTQGVRQGLIML